MGDPLYFWHWGSSLVFMGLLLSRCVVAHLMSGTSSAFAAEGLLSRCNVPGGSSLLVVGGFLSSFGEGLLCHCGHGGSCLVVMCKWLL